MSGKILRKPMIHNYNCWEYIGKHFDALGRVYRSDRLPDISFYYFIDGNKIYKPRTVEEYSEFDVWLGTIRESNGNVLRIFSMEDKSTGLKRDSTVYLSGNWEVFEIDDKSKETRSRTSWGTKSLYKYDAKMRLTEGYVTDGKGDTLVSEQYFWKKGKLVKTIIGGVERVFVYGKKSGDVVRVIPPDDNMFLHPGYDGTAGIIPEEGDPSYRLFTIAPYAYYARNDKEEPYHPNPIFPLLRPSINNTCVLQTRPDIPLACKRYEKEDAVTSNKILDGYFPGETIYGKSAPTFGDSKGNPIFTFECKCDSEDGYYYFEYSDALQNKYIEVMESNWKYDFNTNIRGWKELCWSRNDMQRTYEHERKHIENAETVARRLFEYMSKERTKTIYKIRTREECEQIGNSLVNTMASEWNYWSGKEKEHNNKTEDPVSPDPTGTRIEVLCLVP
jgi:hypothetical protein